MQLNREKILQKAIDTYGSEAQIRMMMEEMAELQKELCKLYRAKDSTHTIAIHDRILDEMADVQIMLDQMRLLFGDTDSRELEKLRRLAERLGMEDVE